jgi:hypothetical protein
MVSRGKEWRGSIYFGYISCPSHSSSFFFLLSLPHARVEGCFAELLHQHIKIVIADPQSQALHSHIQIWSRQRHDALVIANPLVLLVPRKRVLEFCSSAPCKGRSARTLYFAATLRVGWLCLGCARWRHPRSALVCKRRCSSPHHLRPGTELECGSDGVVNTAHKLP